ncbi:maestro heat-like repeat-containing protein family member 2A isoform X3 [Hemicordylus capensis]|uniref:maestro heat-like repeat-containing protein family member 2A isoform X3 n=1 Tax=Hemicordylus capensis TaxID=884348 RepID=UPI0023023CD1|nr:maestro heat-like repeat-containing protein family member 2A isoform X3 [Hemicordylus capensis]
MSETQARSSASRTIANAAPGSFPTGERTRTQVHDEAVDIAGAPSCGGLHYPIRHLLELPEESSPKEVVLRIVRAARLQPAAVMPILVVTLQQGQASVWQKVAVYRSLRAMLEHGLEVEPVREFIAAASEQLRASPGETPRELQLAASNALATFARGHFNPIMMELQRQLRPFAQPHEFTLLTLGKIAAANVYGYVPFLGITLTTMQTVTRRLEDSGRRRALCTALGQMCGAIRIYLRSWEKSSYPRISVQQFSAYLLPLYTCLSRTWLPASDSQQVKLAILKALGPMLSILLPRTEFQAQIFDDISLLLAQYESNAQDLYVTKILAQILQASLANNNPIPRRHVEPLACALTRQICPRGEKRSPSCHTRENHAEISHIFLQLARLHPTALLGFFQRELEAHQEEMCVALLVLLSRIVGAQLPELWSRRQLCVKAVKAVLGDDGPKVRLATLQAIGQLLCTGYLERVEGWPLNYISLQLAVSAHQLGHPTPGLPLGGLEEKTIQRASMEVLCEAVTSKRGTSQELWTKMLSFLLQPHYTDSATPLCRGLTLLACERLRWVVGEQSNLKPGNSAAPQELLARILALVVSPFEGSGRGAAALLLLKALRPEVYKDVAEHWWVEVPIMVNYLQGHSRYTLEPAAWELQLLEFLKKSIRRNQESGWNLALGKEIMKQVQAHPSSTAEKLFLYKALGTALSAARDSSGVALQLQDLLLHTDYMDETEQKGICSCLNYCAEGQLSAVLRALSWLEEEISEGEDSGHLHLGQGLPQPEKSRMKAALLRLYSSVTTRAPQDELLLQLASVIVPKILHHYKPGSPEGVKGTQLALSFIQCVSEISLSIQGRADPTTFQLPQKRALLEHLVDIVKAEPLDALVSPVRQQAMAALRHLSKVPELLSLEENVALVEACLHSVIALPPLELAKGASQTLYAGALASLAELVETLLDNSGDHNSSEWFQGGFQAVFRLLEYWLGSEHEWERARAMHLGVHLLWTYRQKSSPPLRIPRNEFGYLVGVLGPFTCDTLSSIRQGAGDCIQALLGIQGNRTPQGPKRHDQAWRLQCIQQDLPSESSRVVRIASFQLAKEIVTFLRTLLEQLRTVGVACDRTVLLWFEVAVRERGRDLRDKVRSIVAIVCSYLQPSKDPGKRLFLTRAVCILAEHHCRMVCASLLNQPLFQDRARKELWTALVTYKDCCTPILKYLLGWLSLEAYSCVPVLTALHEAVSGLKSCASLLPMLSELCHMLLCQLSRLLGDETLRSDGTGPQTPFRLAAAVLQAVLYKVLPEVAKELDAANTWMFLVQPGGFLKGVSLLARALARSRGAFLDGLLHHLLPPLSSPEVPGINLSLAFCMELTGHPVMRNPETLDLLVQRLLAKFESGNAAERLLAVQGLGNVAEGAPEEAKKHQKAFLATLLQATDDASSLEIACEGLRALGKVWGCLGGRRVGYALRAAASRARLHLQQADDALRAAAFELFGQLAQAAPPKHAKSFAKEVGPASAALLLHFRDPSPAVAKACYTAFLHCALFMGLQELAGDMDAGLLTDALGAQHTCLMGKVCRQLAQTDPALLDAVIAEVPRYAHCTWEGIRLAACKLAGILVEAMETQHLVGLDLEPLLQSLQALHKDPCPAIEAAASEAARIVQQKWQEGADAGACGRRGWLLFSGWLFSRRPKEGLVGVRPRPI